MQTRRIFAIAFGARSYRRALELENRGGAFEKVSGLEPPALMVEQGGWSWGGQLVDLDNDSYLDVYTLSGYYTAPREFAEPIDT